MTTALFPLLLAASLAAAPGLPQRLSETGLYRGGEVAPENLPFAPQYPLWTDGAEKRRWVRLPRGTFIDASRPDAWRFPVGTRFWKEFRFGGRPVETRLIERTGAGWRYATYAWDARGTEAFLAPERGVPGAAEIGPGLRHGIPGRPDCRTCHEGGPTPILGFSTLQLSPDRDPRAPHAELPPPGAVDLRTLVARGLLRGLPAAMTERPPRVPARSATERAALGYLHANCGTCHNDRGPLFSVGLWLEQLTSGSLGPVLRSTVSHPSQFRPDASARAVRIHPGRPDLSILVLRMRSRAPLSQMPPLGTVAVDGEGVRLIEQWITEMPTKENER